MTVSKFTKAVRLSYLYVFCCICGLFFFFSNAWREAQTVTIQNRGRKFEHARVNENFQLPSLARSCFYKLYFRCESTCAELTDRRPFTRRQRGWQRVSQIGSRKDTSVISALKVLTSNLCRQCDHIRDLRWLHNREKAAPLRHKNRESLPLHQTPDQTQKKYNRLDLESEGEQIHQSLTFIIPVCFCCVCGLFFFFSNAWREAQTVTIQIRGRKFDHARSA